MSQKKKTATKNISVKNYVCAALILIGAIIFTLYIFEWYQVKREEKLMTSYLISSKTIDSNITDLESLKQIRQESPASYFIYFGYTGDEEVYKLEKEMKRVIDKYKLNDIFYYVDLTELKENKTNYLNEVNKNLEIKSLNNVPAIIYVNEGKIEEKNILDGINNNLLSVSDFENLLKNYEFEAVK